MGKLSAIVLAGGNSSRMGTDKSALNYNGIPLYKWMCNQLEQADIHDIRISSNSLPDGVPDIYPDKGPLGGIYSTIQSLKTTRAKAIIVPVDMPLLQPKDYLTLVKSSEGVDCVSYSGAIFPIIIKITPDLINFLENTITTSQQRKSASIKALLHFFAGNHKVMDIDEPARFMNTNTPEDWEQAISYNKQGSHINHE